MHDKTYADALPSDCLFNYFVKKQFFFINKEDLDLTPRGRSEAKLKRQLL